MRILQAMLMCILVFGGCLSAPAAERILDYHSDIAVRKDGTLDVTETVKVRAEGHRIRHGIYRDFPTRYPKPSKVLGILPAPVRGEAAKVMSELGPARHVGFQLLGVTRDGHDERYHTKGLSNGVRIYAGSRKSVVSRGIHTYTFHYLTDHQLRFFKDHDELYWNVTGNGWAFPIDQASATVRLPGDVPAGEISVNGYTGVQGATATDYRARPIRGGAEFETTAALGQREGLTVVMGWPKGVVTAPSPKEGPLAWLDDNRPLAVALLGGGVLLVYLLGAWLRVGRDPRGGVIIPLYHPPEGLSPGAARYVCRQTYDDKAFAAGLVGLASKGYLEITEDSDGDYVLKRMDAATAPLTRGEKSLLKELMVLDELTLDNKQYRIVKEARDVHENVLKAEYEGSYFNRNRGYLVPAFVVLVLTWIGAVIAQGDLVNIAFGAFLTFWVGIWTFGVYGLVTGLVGAWGRAGRALMRAGRSAGKALGFIGSLIQAAFITAFSVPFVIAELAALTIIAFLMGLETAGILALAVVVTVVFYHLMKAPTLAGRKVLDQIEGFRLYLSVAEKDALKLAGAPRVDQKLYEAYLPYAVALDVENEWGERFAAEMGRLGQSVSADYSPGWYHGASFSTAGFTAFSGGLSSAVSAASTPQSSGGGSSSGFSGGSSGGGGGGGGGGGW